MTFQSQFRFGPASTPDAIRKLIFATSGITLLVALIDPIFSDLLSGLSGGFGPEKWLSLSWWGLTHYLLWQPISFLFVQYTGFAGVTFGYLIALFFKMYVLWFTGAFVYEWIGKRPFLAFYFTCGILAGLTALLLMPVTGQYAIISGADPAIIAVVTLWVMMNPEAEIYLFFLIPIKARYLVLGGFAALLLISLSQFSFPTLIFYLSAAFYGYAAGIVIWGFRGPFPQTKPFDELLARWGGKIERVFFKKGKSKVVDFSTGEEISDDDRFVDAMLKKISQHGESSLSWKERKRMKKISERKRREK